MKTFFAFVFSLALAVTCWAQPAYVRNNLDTNNVGTAPADGANLTSTNGVPVWSTNQLTSTTINSTTINSTTINVNGKAQFNQIVITNGFFAQTNLWSGPTNTVDVSIYDQEYQTVTPVQFGGIINSSNSFGGEVKMTIKNAAASNITATAVNGFIFANGDTSETITNGHRGVFWINHDPALGGQTNIVFQHF